LKRFEQQVSAYTDTKYLATASRTTSLGDVEPGYDPSPHDIETETQVEARFLAE
jgi:hypothetical protein